MTAKEAIRHAADALREISDEAETEAALLVSALAGVERSGLPFFGGEIDETALNRMLEKRLRRVPLQYILGKWCFYKGEFFVGEGVLIPRQDTETLVETAVDFLKGKANPTVADLCAGSGCVGISIAADFPSAAVTAVEKYEPAFSYLKKNIEYNHTENVTPVLGDIADPFGQYDLIVSNPPYIAARDMTTLSDEVRNEPETALFGGSDGLDFYRLILEKWTPHLYPGGMLAVEIGIGQEKAVTDLFLRAGLKDVGAKRDLCGVQRVIFGTANFVK